MARQSAPPNPPKGAPPEIAIHPLTPDRWSDLERLFGPRGAVGGCWCMWWRLKASEFEKQKGETNKRTFRKIVDSEEVPGLIAYIDDEPVAWCAVQPRDAYPRLDRSRVLKRVDDQPVWSVTCFFIAKNLRRTGLTKRLLEAAIAHARERGARIVEGYPVEPRKHDMPTVFAYTGFASAFRAAGFEEVLRRSETRPIMRYHIETS